MEKKPQRPRGMGSGLGAECFHSALSMRRQVPARGGGCGTESDDSDANDTAAPVKAALPPCTPSAAVLSIVSCSSAHFLSLYATRPPPSRPFISVPVAR